MSISSSTQSDPSHESTASPSIARIDLSALGHNLDQVRRRIPTGCNILAVVKADAYGHGALPIAGELARLGINRFGVATVQEGLHLRNAGLAGSILILGALQPQHIETVVQHRLTPIIHDGLMAEQLAKLIPSRARPYPVHIKVDTGMSRLGLAPDDVLPLLQSSWFRETLAPEGLMTHLADADGEEPTFTTHQMKRFYALIAAIESAGITIPLIHAANSAGILRPGVKLPTRPEEVEGPVHPLVRVHPVTGRRALYLGRRRDWPSNYIIGMPNDESEALLDRLWAHATQPKYAWTHHWQIGDVVLWDNRCCMHYRTEVDTKQRRVMHRTTIKGEAPVAPW